MPRRSPKAATEITAADRKAAAVELRARGYTFERIADELGYANASGASKAYHAALKARPAQNVDQIRGQEAARLEWLWRKTADIVEDPGPKSSAIGKIVVFPPGHEKAGEPVPDSSTALRAATEYRHQSESLRKLYAADVAAAPSTVIDNSSTYLAQINQFRVEHGQQPYRVREPSGPPIPRDQAIAQARAAIERERRTPEGGIIVPPGVAAEGAAAITAWVTSQQYYAKIAADAPSSRDASGDDDDVVDAEIVD